MKIFGNIVLTLFVGLLCVQCSDWTTPEPNYTEPYNRNSEEYYEALREYKNTEHPVMFGWYSGWTGIGDNMINQLRGVPDSMDIISLWENSDNLTPEQLSDLQEVREKKGTRVVTCTIVSNIGDGYTPQQVDQDFIVDGVQYNSREEARAAYWGWYGNYGDTSEEGIKKAIRKYANAIVDLVDKYNYNGFDIDYEPHFGYGGNVCSYQDRMHILIEELGKRLGPQSGTGRLLVVDGEPQNLLPESGQYLDYYIIQSYNCDGDADLDRRFNELYRNYQEYEDEETVMKKLIWTENFEAYAGTGGPEFETRDGEILPYSLMGMGLYYREGVNARIGGCGAYRFNLCRPINDYLKIREVIQLMNPAKH